MPQPIDFQEPKAKKPKLQIVSKIGSGKYDVFLASTKPENKKYAMKAFPFANNEPNPQYKKEQAFKFNHPHIIKIHDGILCKEA